jgi:hypothetical protein
VCASHLRVSTVLSLKGYKRYTKTIFACHAVTIFFIQPIVEVHFPHIQ